MNEPIQSYMTDADREACTKANSFDELAEIAVGILERMRADGHRIVQICGPYSTGGLGSKEQNEARFKKVIKAAQQHSNIVFDQMPFEDAIKRIVDGYQLPEGEYCHDVLDIFYKKIFESGHVVEFMFIPGWESSTGAKWERAEAERLGIAMSDVPAEWL